MIGEGGAGSKVNPSRPGCVQRRATTMGGGALGCSCGCPTRVTGGLTGVPGATECSDAEPPGESTRGGGGLERGEKFPYVSIRAGSSWGNVSQERRAGLGPSWKQAHSR